MSSKSVKVEIAGLNMTVRTDVSQEDLEQIVGNIREKLRTVEDGTPGMATNRRMALTLLMMGEAALKAEQQAAATRAALSETRRRAETDVAEARQAELRLQQELRKAEQFREESSAKLAQLKNENARLSLALERESEQRIQASDGAEHVAERLENARNSAQAALQLLDETDE